jgi:hypothetical protein
MHRSLISSKCQRWFLLASMSSIKEWDQFLWALIF